MHRDLVWSFQQYLGVTLLQHITQILKDVKRVNALDLAIEATLKVAFLPQACQSVEKKDSGTGRYMYFLLQFFFIISSV